MNITRVKARIKRMVVRIAKIKKKRSVYERKLKVGGTEKRKARLKKRIIKANARMDKLNKRIAALYVRMNASKVKATQAKGRAHKRARTKTKNTTTKKTSTDSAKLKVPGEQKTKLSPEMVQRIHNAAHRTFNVIAGDLLNAVAEFGGDSIKQIEVIESVFDADRMGVYGGDKEAYEATKSLTWEEIVKLGKKIFPYKSYS